jgi:DNA-binding GntR family transcriptional regulator
MMIQQEKQAKTLVTTQPKTPKSVIKGGGLAPASVGVTGLLPPALLVGSSSSGLTLISKPQSVIETVAEASTTALGRLSVQQLPQQKPDFSTSPQAKDLAIADWLTHFIMTGLAEGTLREAQLLPLKQDLARYLGVSAGTVQNAIRYVEDLGHVQSKQRIGTQIRRATGLETVTLTISDAQQVSETQQSHPATLRKQVSKRDKTIVAIEQWLVQQQLAVGVALPSSRELAKVIGATPNTTRLALEYLTQKGLLAPDANNKRKQAWVLTQCPTACLGQSAMFINSTKRLAIESLTLIDQIELELKTLIAQHHNVGDRLPSHATLARDYQVSIKTIHDAMSRLAKEGLVYSKRGRYGTFIKKPLSS